MEAEEVDGRDRGHHDGEGGGEALENVIGIFDHHGHQQATERLVKNHAPYNGRVAKQEALLGDLYTVVPPQAEQAQERPEKPQLHVAEPQ